jgi:dolichol-phosphate mannosyltransferase
LGQPVRADKETDAMHSVVLLLATVQATLAARVLWRLMRTAGGQRVPRHVSPPVPRDRVTVLVPVLNEAARLNLCLDGLSAQGAEVAEILVIDGGSTDDTRLIVHRFAERDRRIQSIDATPVPSDRNGKAHGLQIGFDRSSDRTEWILTIDADVRPDPLLVRSLLVHAVDEGVAALSAATLQRLSGPAEGFVHPAMLATLVYRFGIPGHATAQIDQVQANGQCFLVRRTLLESIGGFTAVADSICEDVTLARAIAEAGHPVGFYETDRLVSVEMYAGWRDAWDNWTRSLPMRDRFSPRAPANGLSEVLLVQALPLWLAPLLVGVSRSRHPWTILNIALLCTRFGVLVGMARAYDRRPWTYWLSPVCDLPVAIRLWSMSRRRSHVWRGRPFVAGGTA